MFSVLNQQISLKLKLTNQLSSLYKSIFGVCWIGLLHHSINTRLCVSVSTHHFLLCLLVFNNLWHIFENLRNFLQKMTKTDSRRAVTSRCAGWISMIAEERTRRLWINVVFLVTNLQTWFANLGEVKSSVDCSVLVVVESLPMKNTVCQKATMKQIQQAPKPSPTSQFQLYWSINLSLNLNITAMADDQTGVGSEAVCLDQSTGASFLPAPPVSSCSRPPAYFFKCPETSLVISNMLTCFLPLKTAFRFSSALMRVFFFASCRPALRM